VSDDEIPTFIESGLAAWREGGYLQDPDRLAGVAGSCRNAIRDQAARIERAWQRDQRGLPPDDEDEPSQSTGLPMAALISWLNVEFNDEELDLVLSGLLAVLRDHHGPHLKSVPS